MQVVIIVEIIIFCVSLFVLVYSADKFISSAEKIGLSLGIPNFVIGVTVVALGTSLPELVSSIIAILDHSPDIVIGNVVGSNITNILLVLGMVAYLSKGFEITFNFKKIDLPFFILSALFLFFTCKDQLFSLTEALVGVILLIAYIIITITDGKLKREQTDELDRPTAKTYFWLLAGGVGIYFGAKYNVSSVINIGHFLNVSPGIIALTAVALGTSLPELFVSIAAIQQKNAEIAVGNVLGSNIFNSLAILGIPRFVGALEIPDEVAKTSVPIMLTATVLFIVFTWNKKMARWNGIVLLIAYLVFLYTSVMN